MSDQEDLHMHEAENGDRHDDYDGAGPAHDGDGPMVLTGPGSRSAARLNSLKELALPMARVKRLAKSEGEVTMMTQEAALVITKATELFIDLCVTEAFDHMVAEKRVTVMYKDLAGAVAESERLEFLKDIVPEKVIPSKIAQLASASAATPKPEEGTSRGGNRQAVDGHGEAAEHIQGMNTDRRPKTHQAAADG